MQCMHMYFYRCSAEKLNTCRRIESLEGRKEDFERHVGQFFENFDEKVQKEKGQEKYEAAFWTTASASNQCQADTVVFCSKCLIHSVISSVRACRSSRAGSSA